MKSAIYLLFALLLAGCTYDKQPLVSNPQPDPSQLPESQFVASNNNFAFKLFQAVHRARPDSNIFISPFSVSMALGMTLNGADSTTFEQIRSVLGFENYDLQAINHTYQNYFKQLTGIDEKVVFEIANSIWYARSFAVLPSFLDVNHQFFNAQVYQADFANPQTVNLINNWVAEKTRGKISSIISYIPREALMYLINAIYFKGNWTYTFDPRYTQDWDFETLKEAQAPCKMMFVTKKFPHYVSERLQMVQLPYGNGHFNMAVIVPGKAIDFSDFVDSFNCSDWQSWLKGSQIDSGTVGLPRIKMGFSMVLNDLLKQMGMTDAFNPLKANFDRLSPEKGVFINVVKHKTFLEVNEQGTEAAGVTLVGFGRTANSDFFEMIAQRPFLFVIFEKDSGAILFMGQMVKPEE